ncbi:MAG: NAD(P)H-hydrate dehydratase [Spartobacteria bacterium]|nr:NAD(P)H-hydrate dehydratase [Spartobacteria bacterium]
MKAVRVAQMQQIDRLTIEAGTPGETLMDRAGRGLAEHMLMLAEWKGWEACVVELIAGRGNNGGDAFVAARYLFEEGFPVVVRSTAEAGDFSGDALIHLNRMLAAGIPLCALTDAADWQALDARLEPACIVVDGLLGTGTNGAPREPVAAAIRYINAMSKNALIVAIDIPSGLNGDTGLAEGEVVIADMTVTMAAPKRGLLQPGAVDCVGRLEVVDIGVPDACMEAETDSEEWAWIAPTDVARALPRRKRTSHKGTYGHVLVIGGALGYTGAVTMAVKAALRSGAGLVTALVPRSIVSLVALHVPEAMVVGVDETEAGSISHEIWSDWRPRMEEFDALLMGPGMTRHKETFTLVRQILRESSIPLVVDADAISVFAGQPHWLDKSSCPLVLTPHPGELAALLGLNAADVQADRPGHVLATARATGAVVALKGAGTLVAAEGVPLHVNLTGNPGMATGGSGDVLAGLTAGLLGQGLSAFDAACAAVYLHGHAGDRVAWRTSQAGLIAGDLIEELPGAFADVVLR